MATKSKPYKFKKKKISPVIQGHILKSKYPNSILRSVNHIKLLWEVSLKPTPLSDTYRVKLQYKLYERPNVWVIKPKLQKFDNKKIPHRFHDGSLCLFRYLYNEWNASLRIADTIIPWTSLWLYYYEIWLATGIWYGGGEHPKSKDG